MSILSKIKEYRDNRYKKEVAKQVASVLADRMFRENKDEDVTDVAEEIAFRAVCVAESLDFIIKSNQKR